jgi:hypothetical protein
MLDSKLDINRAKKFHEYERKEYSGYLERTKEASQFLDAFRDCIIERLSLNDTVFSTLKEILQEKHRWGKDITYVDIDVYFNEWDVEICGGTEVFNDLRWTSSGIYIPLNDMVKMIADNKLGKKDFEKYWVNKKEKKLCS